MDWQVQMVLSPQRCVFFLPLTFALPAELVDMADGQPAHAVCIVQGLGPEEFERGMARAYGGAWSSAAPATFLMESPLALTLPRAPRQRSAWSPGGSQSRPQNFNTSTSQ